MSALIDKGAVVGLTLRGGMTYQVLPESMYQSSEQTFLIGFKSESLFQSGDKVIQRTVDVLVDVNEIVAIERNPITRLTSEAEA